MAKIGCEKQKFAVKKIKNWCKKWQKLGVKSKNLL